MIKDVFKLRKNSWHMSLMTWTWGYTYKDFSNMCPYFWLSVLNVFILPGTLLIKLLAILAVKLNDYIAIYEEKCRIKENEYWTKLSEEIRNNPDSEIASKIIKSKVDWDFSKKPNKRWFNKWCELSQRTDLFEYGSKLWDIYNKKSEEFNKNRSIKPEKTNRQKIGANTVVIKNTAKVLGVILGIIVVYLVVKLLIMVPWVIVGIFLLKVLLCLICLLILAAVIYGAAKLVIYLFCRYGNFCIPCEDRREKISNFFYTIGKGITWPFVWFVKGIISLWHVGMALKADNCPAIDWED